MIITISVPVRRPLPADYGRSIQWQRRQARIAEMQPARHLVDILDALFDKQKKKGTAPGCIARVIEWYVIASFRSDT